MIISMKLTKVYFAVHISIFNQSNEDGNSWLNNLIWSEHNVTYTLPEIPHNPIFDAFLAAGQIKNSRNILTYM